MSFVKSYNNEQQEMIIAQALETDEGRTALAQAMVEPIRRSLEYQAVGRKLLMVDELPQGALARYERDVAAVAFVVSRRGAVPDQIQEGEEILVPTWEIAANPTIRLSEIKARRFYIVDRAQIKAKEAIQKEEDEQIFNALINAARADQTQTIAGGALTTASLNAAYREIEQHDLVCTKVVMHANRYADVRFFNASGGTTASYRFYDEATTREILTTGLYGHLWTADLHVSSRMNPAYVLCVASPDTVGAFPIRQDITVLPADDPKKLRLGWVIYEEVGVAVINDYSVALITVTGAGVT
jgi:hypothetical protein